MNKTKSLVSKFLLLAVFLYHIFSVSMVAYANDVAAPPEIQVDIPVNITIDLEDESRFMGIDLYQIADYQDGNFVYLDSYKELDVKEYQRLSREKDKLELAKTVSDYVLKKGIKADYSKPCEKGKVVFDNLPVGVYVVLQSKGDCNASLAQVFIIEAPTWSEDTSEYLYDIESYPKWNREIWFSFRPEIVIPCLWVIGLILSLALCILGPKLFRTFFYVAVSLGGGFFGTLLAPLVDDSFLISMVFFVCFAFFGLAVAFFVLTVTNSILKKLRLHNIIEKNQYWLVPLIGAVAFSILLFRFVISNYYIVAVVFVVILAVSHWLQRRNKKEQIRFYTYDDLISLKPRSDIKKAASNQKED